MAALPVKTEINQESKYGSTQDSKGNIFAAQDVANLGRDDGEEGTLYVCGNCTAQLYFRPDSRLLWPKLLTHHRRLYGVLQDPHGVHHVRHHLTPHSPTASSKTVNANIGPAPQRTETIEAGGGFCVT